VKNFFEHQEKARRQTIWLTTLFGLAVVGIVLAVNIVALAVLGAAEGDPAKPKSGHQGINFNHESHDPWKTLPDNSAIVIAQVKPVPEGFFFWVSGITLLVILSGTLYKTNELSRGGGAAVAQMFEGKFLTHSTRQAKEKTLLNVVEEMAIASGIAPPRVYLVDSPSINAFAAGNTANTAVIGVTKGCLKELSRQELQGVVAHEFSHIINGDMKNNLRLVGLLHGILLLAITGRILVRAAARSRGGGRNSGQGKLLFFLIGLSLILIGYIGVFFGKLIKAAVSRQREFLADATAVQYTRNPEGIHGALKKISRAGTYVDNPSTEEVAHLFFGNAMLKSSSGISWRDFFGLLATHPPLEERMSRILPEWKDQNSKARQDRTPSPSNPPRQDHSDEISGLSEASFEQDIGRLDRPLLDASGEWLNKIPPAIQESLLTPPSAAALLLATLSSNLNSFYQDQLKLPAEARLDPTMPLPEHTMGNLPEDIQQQALELRRYVGKLNPSDIPPLVELALSTIRELPAVDLKSIAEHVREFQGYHETESLPAYAISTLVRSRLLDASPPEQKTTTVPSDPALNAQLLLSVLAHNGHPDQPEAASAAYNASIKHLSKIAALSSLAGSTILPVNECLLYRFDKALFELKPSSVPLRKAILRSCLTCIAHDKKVEIPEKELFRAIAGVLDCPSPPTILDISLKKSLP